MTERKAAQKPEENDTNQPQTQLLLQRGEDGQLIIHVHLPPVHINGDPFGNSLYRGREPDAQAHSRRESESMPSPEPRPIPPGRVEAGRSRVLDLAARMGGDEAKVREWVRKRYGSDLADLDGRQLADAIRSLAAQLNRRRGEARAA